MKTTRLLITVKYNNGNELKQLVNYIHSDAKSLQYTVDKQIHSAVSDIVRIPFENIEAFDLEMVECDGWKY
jgi:hypothetical protein